MATVKHPDTYTCDICGNPFDCERKVKLPVLFDKEEYEYGVHALENPKLEHVDMDICEDCLSKVIKVKGTHGFYRPDTYRIEE